MECEGPLVRSRLEGSGTPVFPRLAREPVPAVTCLDYTLFSVVRGGARDAEERIRLVVEADPLMVFHRLHLVLILMVTGRDQEAEQELRHMLEIDEHHYVSWLFWGHVLLPRGQMKDALCCYEKADSLLPGPRTAAPLAGALALTGNTERAEELLHTLGPPSRHGVRAAWMMFYLIQGDTNRAADCFEKTLDQRDHISSERGPAGTGAELAADPYLRPKSAPKPYVLGMMSVFRRREL